MKGMVKMTEEAREAYAALDIDPEQYLIDKIARLRRERDYNRLSIQSANNALYLVRSRGKSGPAVDKRREYIQGGPDEGSLL